MNDLRVILVRPSQPRNIGAVVRVCANFGAESLWLVGPFELSPEQEREARVASAGAWDVVGAPRCVPTLQEAIGECITVVGTSARQRAGMGDAMSPRELAAQQGAGLTAVVFGAESQGLSTSELGLCHRWMRIPVSDRFPSLNLSHAVALVCYEWSMQGPADTANRVPTRATVSAQEHILGGLEDRLQAVGVSQEEAARASAQLRQLLHRATATDEDLGLINRIIRRLGAADRK